MTDIGETPRIPDLEFPDISASTADRTLSRFPEAPAIAAEIMAEAAAAQHGGNRSPEGSDRPDPGHYAATRAARQKNEGIPAFGRASDEDWENVGKHE